MTPDSLKTASTDELKLVLSFFPRVNTMLSLILAINTGMLGILAANAPSIRVMTWPMIIAAIVTVVAIAVSIVFLYRGAFPNLDGGHDSLIYFREIARRAEHKFIEEFKIQSEDAYINDILSQVWRNSEILRAKFDSLKMAFVSTAIAIVPWVLSLALFVAHNNAASLLVR